MSLITFLETKKTDNGKLFFKLIEKNFMRKTIMNITCKWRESIQVTCKISAETLKPIWERNNCCRNWQSSIYTNFTINRQIKKITKTTNFIHFWLLNTLKNCPFWEMSKKHFFQHFEKVEKWKKWSSNK